MHRPDGASSGNEVCSPGMATGFLAPPLASRKLDRNQARLYALQGRARSATEVACAVWALGLRSFGHIWRCIRTGLADVKN